MKLKYSEVTVVQKEVELRLKKWTGNTKHQIALEQIRIKQRESATSGSDKEELEKGDHPIRFHEYNYRKWA